MYSQKVSGKADKPSSPPFGTPSSNNAETDRAVRRALLGEAKGMMLTLHLEQANSCFWSPLM